MEFFESIKQVQTNWQPYKKWETEQNDKEFQRQNLQKRIPIPKEELEQASEYGRTIIDSINTMDQYSINKAEDVEMASKLALGGIEAGLGILGLGLIAIGMKLPRVQKYLKNLNGKQISANEYVKLAMIPTAISMLLPLSIIPIFTVKFASYEKEASRIARYQAREKELKDPKNFVIYDKEQIAEAKKIAQTLPNPVDKDKKKNSLNMFSDYGSSMKTIKTLKADHQNYLDWKKEHLKAEKKKTESLNEANISPEQLKNAKKDQDNLLRIIRKIELSSQNYLNNVEMACNIALVVALAGGAAIGSIISKAVKSLANKKNIQTLSKNSEEFRKALPIIGGLGVVIATASYFVKAKKEAAKIGRFKAKQDLLKDPYNFVTYSDEQLASVKDLKAPKKEQKGIYNKFKDNIKFFFQLKKDYKEYKHYQKIEAKEEQKLKEALKRIKVSDEQLNSGKSLQKNAFMAFEKIDEMTQRYVDDTEAATDIGKQYITSGLNLAGMAGTMYLLAKPVKNIKNKNNFMIKMLPAIASLLASISIELKSTQIKKEAGKIGTMNAMKDLDDPRLFVNHV